MEILQQRLTRDQQKVAKEIGHYLREKRENLDYTLDYVSEVIRISVYSIEQLEEGNYTFFRSMIFLKGALKNYCNFIKVSPIPLLQKIDEVFQLENIPDITVKKKKSTTFGLRSFWLNLIISFIIVTLIAVEVYFLLFSNLDNTEVILKETIAESQLNEKVPASILENKELVLLLKAKKDGWIRLVSEKDRSFELVIKKDVEYSWVVNEDFELILATQDLAEVFLNQATPIFLDTKNQKSLITFDFNSF